MSKKTANRRPTIHDVARRASVSAATASKVVRGMAGVKKPNVERVRAAMDELNYRMDPIASGLRNERRRIIGTIVPDLESTFFGALVTELEKEAEEAGYHLIVASARGSEMREADLVARMNDWRVMGTILVPVRSEKGLGAEKLRELDMRAVLVDRVNIDDRYDTVTADNSAASASVADLLVAQNHRRILLHGATRVSKSIRLRTEGFSARIKECDPDVRIDTLLSDETLDTQRQAIRSYFDTAGDGYPTAVFSCRSIRHCWCFQNCAGEACVYPMMCALSGLMTRSGCRQPGPALRL
nr:LacI family DNA-binding transcriptional regulator [Marinicella sp. W31]MDC2880236.1 LacI family DNA-binding transcriptional regulator [Marinicella sp. W31]